MTDRRTILSGGAPGQGGDMANMAAVEMLADNISAIPDVMVMTHEGQVAKFYSELISEQVVMINFMSIRNEAKFPISRKMAEIAGKLGDRLGRDVQIFSITSDPTNDTPEKLAAFHKELGGYAGWTFVTTPEESAAALAHRFYRHGRNVVLGGRTDIVQYGNAKVGLWGTFPWDVHTDDAAERVTWVMPREVPTGEMRRAGPRPIGAEGQRWNNRIA